MDGGGHPSRVERGRCVDSTGRAIDIAKSSFWRSLDRGESIEVPPARWSFRKWGSMRDRASRLYRLVRLLRPEVIVETGTFEGQGTYALAAAASANKNNARVFTFDYDGDPTTTLPDAAWEELKSIRQSTLDLIQKEFPGCKVEYLEGDTRQILSRFLEDRQLRWDLFFQDSMHFHDGISAEWTSMRAHASEKAVVVFDDIDENHEFARWFKAHEVQKGWVTHSVGPKRLPRALSFLVRGGRKEARHRQFLCQRVGGSER
jgi:predicted O-methyltransferase YrrM